jgi:hypothetical protein
VSRQRDTTSFSWHGKAAATRELQDVNKGSMLGQALDFVPYQAKVPSYSPRSDRKRMKKRGKAQCPYKTVEKEEERESQRTGITLPQLGKAKFLGGRHDLSRKARWSRGSYRVGCPCSSKAAIGSQPWFWGPFRSLGWGSTTGDRLYDLNAHDVEGICITESYKCKTGFIIIGHKMRD